ncbi:MAG TPA: hypothetical protein ENN14_01025 [Chloroflexi bacterium]|nr:hypothetical protein [Chloroflexota bacterium]
MRLCPRCMTDVSAWERESITFGQFIVQRGGWLGLLPSLAALLAWILYWPGRPLYHWLAGFVALSVSLVIFRVLYIKRFYWRERWLASQVYDVRAHSLITTVTTLLALGLLLFVIMYVIYKLHSPPTLAMEEITFIDQMLFSLFYAPSFWAFTAGLTLLAIQAYLDALNERVPQPIFMHTDRLLDVVLRTVIPTLEDRAKLHVRQGPPDVRQAITLEVIKAERLPKDGGIQVLLREGRVTWRSDGNGEFRPSAVERMWNIDADCWGRIRSLSQESLQLG